MECAVKSPGERPVVPVELPSVGSGSQLHKLFSPSPGAAAEECVEGFESLQPTTHDSSRMRTETSK